MQLFDARFKPIPFLKTVTRLWCQKILYVETVGAKGTYYSHGFTARIPLVLFNASTSPDNRRLVHISIFSPETGKMWEANHLNQIMQLKIDNNYVILSKKQLSAGLQHFDITRFVEKALTSRTDTYLTVTVNVPAKFARQDIIVVHSLVLQSIEEVTARVYAQSIVQLQRTARKPLNITIPTKLAEVEKVLMTLASNLNDAPPTANKPAIEDDDIEMGDQIISFVCPLSLKKIQHPSKGKRCKHAQCFDVQSFLKCNMDNIKWKCIVCNEELPFSELIIDVKFKNYLHDYPNLDRCLIHSDGTTAPLPQENRKSRTSTPAVTEPCDVDKPHKRSISEVIELSDESENELEQPPRTKSNPNPSKQASSLSSISQHGPNSSPEIIILD
ncbi:hypothetical protein K493DRAFT_98828 [Basidiobolus meristosporus CBS 931.73]|uniref:SP-RING-type domain-containing protein n=1 Tax=Basidiobolus meristosporus CBS 931.73 TaxID=1314790 RepID=A0A1Y1X302_9FUNG|nr:hypothetical protein K493DRAFT_98828 [Basidiobolus meristosporus CBS 931.73]|eukprot:ORX80153.1 hypothetical protein K493DRAFT_98828 [Basidiobolus meristosporus CBS 931.73]